MGKYYHGSGSEDMEREKAWMYSLLYVKVLTLCRQKYDGFTCR